MRPAASIFLLLQRVKNVRDILYADLSRRAFSHRSSTPQRVSAIRQRYISELRNLLLGWNGPIWRQFIDSLR